MGAARKIKLAWMTPGENAIKVSVPCKLAVMKSEDIAEKPRIVKRDRKGLLVQTKTVLRASLKGGKFDPSVAAPAPAPAPAPTPPVPAPTPAKPQTVEGLTTRVILNENGDVVKAEEVQTFVVIDGKEEAVEALDANIGDGKEVEIIKFVDEEKRHEWLTEKTFEVLVSEDDSPTLWSLADYLEKEGKMGLIDIIERESYVKMVGMVVPIVDRTKNQWSIVVYGTKAKVTPFWNEIPTAESMAKAKQKKAKKNVIKAAGANELFN